MNLLLDTHIFIWWDSDPERLHPATRAMLMNPDHGLLVSVASLWEIQIKQMLGKLTLRLPLADIITHQQTVNGIMMLPITEQHIYALDSLPPIHKDPFDRLLIAQARIEQIPLVTIDSIFDQYPVRIQREDP